MSHFGETGKIEGLLFDLGLTQYEVNIVLTLLHCKRGTAKGISEISRVPLPRTYQILDQFRNRRLVDIEVGVRPSVFVLELETLASKLVTLNKANLEKKVEELKKSGDELAKLLSLMKGNLVSDLPQMGLPVLIGTPGVDAGKFIEARQRTIGMLRRAEKSIWIMAGSFDWIHEVSPTLRERASRIEIKVLLTKPREKKQKAVVELLDELKEKCSKFDYKWYTPGHLRLSLVDEDKEAIVVIWNVPKLTGASDEKTMPSSIIYSDNRLFNRELIRVAFQSQWKR